MNKETIEALHQIEKEKNIPFDVLIEALEDALHSAYQKTAHAVPFSEVKIDRETGEIHVFELIFPPGQEPVIEDEETEIDTSMAERVEITPEDFGRIAAQTAKQVIYQRIREAEQGIVFQEYSNRVGEIVTGIVQQSDSRYTLVDLGRVEARLPKSEQVPTERYEHGMRLKTVIKEVSQNPKEPPIILSRRSEDLVRRLFELEVPEIADGLVEIVGVAREPGYRSKISVVSHSDGVDPVGACVGPRGSRVRMVVSELRGEKIDIIPFDEEPARFVAKSLSPARVREVLLDDDQREATVVVPDDQLSLAIGKDGQNARLANRLTGWKIDIKSETEMSEEETVYVEAEAEPPVVDGRCHALTVGGKRCPNAALPGSLYCGIPSHQAMGGE
jgi:N utilization substance protein A